MQDMGHKSTLISYKTICKYTTINSSLSSFLTINYIQAKQQDITTNT